MWTNHVFSKGHLDLIHHYLVHQQRGNGTITGIVTPRILESKVISRMAVKHKGSSKPTFW